MHSTARISHSPTPCSAATGTNSSRCVQETRTSAIPSFKSENASTQLSPSYKRLSLSLVIVVIVLFYTTLYRIPNLLIFLPEQTDRTRRQDGLGVLLVEAHPEDEQICSAAQRPDQGVQSVSGAGAERPPHGRGHGQISASPWQRPAGYGCHSWM